MNMYQVPQSGYMRIKQILVDLKADPPVNPIVPVSKSTWWDGVKSGRFPKPVKISPRITVWRSEDIQLLLKKESFGFEPMQGKLCKKK